MMNRLILRRLRTFSALGPKAVRARQSAVEKTHALCTLNRSTSSMAKVPARGSMQLQNWHTSLPGMTKPSSSQHQIVRHSTGGPGGGNGNGNGGDGPSGGGDGPEEGGSRRGGVFGLWAAYLSLLDKRPVLTKTVTSALLNAVGDIMSQVFFEEHEGIDWKRTAIFAFLGFALVGPALHFWYSTLARLITTPGTQGALMRLIGDQFFFAPAFIAVFFSSLLTLQGRTQDISAKLKQDWKGAVIANWKLWIPFQFINFRFVPQQLQVLMANIVAVAWNTYLSWASHRQLHSN